ncbi:TPR-like protein [Coprinellus micaceus]|uniref:TPR-like protein n=1 Tax=Coprinellus micaceus TaxID=71717 RepID=A0A4Y7TL62_COPMI|nr:TPR-like protein [Coprinellus micaceus]
MGRTKPKKKQHLAKIQSEPSIPKEQPSVAALTQKAQELIVQCDYELALRFTRRILDQDSSNVEAKEMTGVCLLETGELDEAKRAFQSLISPSPGAPTVPPPSAHLYLAQLSEDDPRGALQHYQSAVNILSAQSKGKDRAMDGLTSDDELELKSNIVRALVGQVEIWMDPQYDLCFEPEAEKTCEDLLNLALQTDPSNSEALQALASVRMSQQRPDDAKQCLDQSWVAWKDLETDDPKLPPIPTRLSLVKLFLELALYTPALLVLHGIMSTDDQDVEAWYLEGWCFYLMAEKAKETGRTFDELAWEELAKDSRDCLETCQVLHKNQDHPDKPILDHVQELISQLEAAGIKASPMEEGEEGDTEGDWEEVVSEDEDGDVEMS